MRGVLNSKMDSMEEQGPGDHVDRQENKAEQCGNGLVCGLLSFTSFRKTLRREICTKACHGSL